MIHLLFYAVGAIAAGVAALIGTSMMKDAQHRVARWLRERGLNKSRLMEAVVMLAQVGVIIRASVHVRAVEQPAEIIRIERTYSMSDIQDMSLRAALRQSQRAELDIMSLFA